MITTAARLGGETSKGNTSAACGALRGSTRETPENVANDSEESPRSSNLAPTSPIEGVMKDVAKAEKRRGATVFPASSGVSPLKKQRIQVIVRIRPIDDKASRCGSSGDHGFWKKIGNEGHHGDMSKLLCVHAAPAPCHDPLSCTRALQCSR